MNKRTEQNQPKTVDQLVKRWMRSRRVKLLIDTQGDTVLVTVINKADGKEESVFEEDVIPALRAAMVMYDVECGSTRRRLPVLTDDMPMSEPDTLERHMKHAVDGLRAKKLVPLTMVPISFDKAKVS